MDSIEARKMNDPSNIELSHLLAWVGQLNTLFDNLGEIQNVDSKIQKKEVEEKTEVVATHVKLRDKKIILAKFTRNKSTDYDGKIYYSEWVEVPNSRTEEHEELPLEPLGEPVKEKRHQKVAKGSQYYEDIYGANHVKRVFGVVVSQ